MRTTENQISILNINNGLLSYTCGPRIADWNLLTTLSRSSLSFVLLFHKKVGLNLEDVFQRHYIAVTFLIKMKRTDDLDKREQEKCKETK